ncbi:MAG: hypothetical protein FIA97_14215 [Methylococcaceae bacterium]|nr:hypothetical protein [Methylococcaceae bacterium]
MDSLFRDEALIAQLDNTDGAVVLARSVPIRCLNAGAGAFAALILVLLFFGEYTQRTPGAGLLVPSAGAIRIVPPTAGTVLDVRVGAGPLMHKGDELFVVRDASSPGYAPTRSGSPSSSPPLIVRRPAPTAPAC